MLPTGLMWFYLRTAACSLRVSDNVAGTISSCETWHPFVLKSARISDVCPEASESLGCFSASRRESLLGCHAPPDESDRSIEGAVNLAGREKDMERCA
eukprot:3611986-Amphidinium_carterae.1